MKNIVLILGVTTLLLSNIACDPGVDFEPENWKPISSQYFINNYEGYDIKLGRIGGLIGMKETSIEGCIYNRGKSEHRLEVSTAILTSAGDLYTGTPNLRFENAISAVSPDACQPFSIDFRFGKYLDKALKEPMKLTLIVKNDGKDTLISIPMTDADKHK